MIHIATTTEKPLNLRPILLVPMLLRIAGGTLEWKVWDQESMQQLVQLETTRSEHNGCYKTQNTMECYKISRKCSNNCGKNNSHKSIFSFSFSRILHNFPCKTILFCQWFCYNLLIVSPGTHLMKNHESQFKTQWVLTLLHARTLMKLDNYI